MLIKQVRYFLAICQERNFTRAARRCGVAQPTVTNAIRVLEREFGGALFDRKPRVVLTALGRVVHPYLYRIVQAADLAHAATKKADGGRKIRSTRSLRSPPAHDSDLIRTGLASARSKRMVAGGDQVEITRLRMTDAGAQGAGADEQSE